ncbi:MAG: DUF4962 domain-containing protein [Planctomycetes bacterium]|nr:DUF4962 domain-containing protein [Planctomycetota bacterium]MBL7043380.1 DUF4962 domain-containing protein [Pirellulaceae bacterium]
MRNTTIFVVLLLFFASAAMAAAITLDEKPAGEDEWGYRPAVGAVSEASPPGFCWRPQQGIVSWELECGRGEGFEKIEYQAGDITMNVHCPPKTFAPGKYTWRYRGEDGEGRQTNWSQPRTFTIAENAVSMPMPPREELLGRIPKTHPRLFVRPEGLPRLRELAQGPMRERFQTLVADCDRLLANPPPTKEPEKYPDTMVRGSKEWKSQWWGNRVYTIKALDSAATLAFTRLLGGKEEYGQLAKRILLDCTAWDPKGATGYRYNDEAGMPYAYYFSRTYTFVHDLLSEEERETCRRMMKIRGDEMYNHLFPRHLWRPYSSHSNRAWHFLGEVGVAFQGEVEGADDWAWFAMNVFYNVYPVWSDDDGGWHEGVSYWSSYIGRFTWWADVMRAAMGIDAYDKPYFAKAGYYAMYMMPPGKVGGGFGDGATRRRASQLVPLMSQLAAQSGNGHWQWYVDQMGGTGETTGYIGFVRGAFEKAEPQRPDDLPTSRLFRGIGQATLNTTLADADEDVQVIFKSSRMGTRSHGNAANNSFVLWAYGQRLLTRTGHYYMYGGPHHRDWVWSTRSLNNITVDGHGQVKRSSRAKGDIIAFETTPLIDVVVGESGEAYRMRESGKDRQLLDRFTRAVLFVKPDLVIVFDRLVAPQPSSFEYWLHAINEFKVPDQRGIETRVGDVVCAIDILAPNDLAISQTNQYDPNPWPQIKTREWHLTATTPAKTKTCEFLALYRPHRADQSVPKTAELKRIDGGYVLKAGVSDGKVVALLPTGDSATLSAEGLKTSGGILVRRYTSDGSVAETVSADLLGN